MPPSINKPNPIINTLPDSITHVYARQHNIKGLSQKYLGPFPVTNRPTRSTIEIKIGLKADGTERKEIRHISDIKVAYLREDAKLAERPKQGRPPKTPTTQSETSSSNASSKQIATSADPKSPNLEDDPPFHGFGTQAIDFPVPHKAGNSNAWQATAAEICYITIL